MFEEFIVKNIQRRTNSRNGNPKFKFILLPATLLDDGAVSEVYMFTPTDAGWVYEINPDALIGKKVVISYRPFRNGFQIESISWPGVGDMYRNREV